MKILTFTRSFANAYLFQTQAGWLLVDSGYPGGEKAFWKFVRKSGLCPTDIQGVLVTHTHADHVGFLKDVLDQSGATLYCASGHLPTLKRGLADYKGIQATSALMRCVLPISTHGGGTNNAFPPLDEGQLSRAVSVNTQEGKEALYARFGVEAIPTSGHTAHCVSYRIGDAVFAGDVAMHIPATPRLIPFIVTDHSSHVESWERLSALDCTLYLGHGAPIESRELGKRLPYLRKVKLRPIPKWQ